MKKLFLMAMLLCLVTALAFAQEATTTETPASTEAAAETPVLTPAAVEITLTGDIIDNKCVGTQTPAELAEFVKTHTRECPLKPDCVASGYSIFADGTLYRFDKESSVKIEEFLKKEDSKLQVLVTANKAGEELNLVSIENQK